MGLESMIWSNYGKAVLLLLIIVVILQAYHMSKLMKFQERSNESNIRDHWHVEKKSNVKEDSGQHIKQEDLLKYVQKLENPHLMDSSGTYMIIPNILSTEADQNNATLTLCTQTTANHLHYLKDLTKFWHGPVSVTVFTYGHDAVLALYSVVYMHTCLKDVQTSFRFHMVFPISNPPINLRTITNMEMHCDNFENLIHKDKNNYESEIPYPHNILRNVAVTYSNTPYIMVIDIDMIPSKDLDENFSQFINRQQSSLSKGDNDERIVYVVPAFESQSDDQIFDKQSLIKEWDLKNIRPFYEKVCWKCQKVTDYDKWRMLPKLPFFDVGYILEWKDPWEPFYITKKEKLPLYDGRFKQYGFNRISQVCELHIAGYQFAVLNNAFLVHRGLKEPGQFHSKKEAENERNRELYKIFKENLKDRYPSSSRQC